MNSQRQRLKILSRLIDRHESSPGRTASLAFSRRFYPDYFDAANPSARDEINSACVSLERDGIARLGWKRFFEGHELKRIVLENKAIDAAYRELGRLPRGEITSNAVAVIAEERGADAPSWFKSVCDDAASSLKAERSFFAMKPDDIERIRAVFKALRAISNLNGDPILKRKLSMAVFNDSKAFNRIETTVVNILKSYGIGSGESEREILESIGIINKPDMTLISGNITVSLSVGAAHPTSEPIYPLTIASFPYIGIPTTSLQDMNVIDVAADYVITIENETSFHEFVANVKENFIAVFLSGYPNRGRTALLRAIRDYADAKGLSLPFYHWGDIDFGGYDIIRSYREKTGIDVIPHLMEPEMADSPLSVRLEDTKRARLEDLVSKNKFHDLTDMASRLLQIGKRVEQESIEAKGIGK